MWTLTYCSFTVLLAVWQNFSLRDTTDTTSHPFRGSQQTKHLNNLVKQWILFGVTYVNMFEGSLTEAETTDSYLAKAHPNISDSSQSLGTWNILHSCRQVPRVSFTSEFFWQLCWFLLLPGSCSILRVFCWSCFVGESSFHLCFSKSDSQQL